MTPARAPCAQIRVQLWPAAGELPPQDAPPWVQQAAAPPPGGAGARTWQLWGGPEDEPDDWTAPDPDDSEAGRSDGPASLVQPLLPGALGGTFEAAAARVAREGRESTVHVYSARKPLVRSSLWPF